jgi:predicted nucleic acid-binding Zn ribbon protein
MPPLLIPIKKTCLHCKRIFGAPQRNSRFCSRKCKDGARNATNAQERLETKAQKPRSCLLCGSPIPPTSRSDKKYCSETCGSAARINLGRMDRRLRVTDGTKIRFFRRSDIYKRDGWKCQICLEPIKPSLRFPDPNCASIDHIIPVSMGGTNRPENLQASHLRCNVSLGNRKVSSVLRPAPLWGEIEYVTIPKAASVWRMSEHVVRRLVREGLIPTVEPMADARWPKIPVTFVEKVLKEGKPAEFTWKRYNHSATALPRPVKSRVRSLICQWCNKHMSVPKGLKSPRKYCSNECLRQSNLSRRRVKERKETRKSKSCVVCGRPNPLIANAYQTILCGRKACQIKRRQMKFDEERLRDRPLPKCLHCGEKFMWRERGGGAPRRYCSEICVNEAARTRARLHHAKKRQTRQPKLVRN